MNNKGMVGFVALFVTAILGVLLIANFAFPVIKQSTSSQLVNEDLTKTNGTVNETFNLTYSPMVTDSLSFAGLTTPENYTVDYTTGQVILTNYTAAATYTAEYSYTLNQYLSNTAERVLFGLVGLALIIGLIVFLLGGFGLTD